VPLRSALLMACLIPALPATADVLLATAVFSPSYAPEAFGRRVTFQTFYATGGGDGPPCSETAVDDVVLVVTLAPDTTLVSESLGGLGTIVLLRHPGDYLTVYGRIEGVTVAKGDFVSQGQKIGVVSPSTQPRMHFEVRHGADSMDPVRFF